MLFVPSAEGGGMEIKMNLNEFLKEEAFSKYNVGIEKIKDDFIESGYEKFLWRQTLKEWDDAKKTILEENSYKYVVNKYVQSFLEQFNNIDDSDVAFIYPESYTPNYFMIQALIKKEAKKDYVIENLLPDDDTINHLAIFCRDKKETIELMNHLVYSAVLGENFGGYKLLGVHLCYYLECCGNDSYAYTMRVPNSLMHYQGYVTRKDTNPYIIYATRKNIEGLVQKGFFRSEFELYLNLKNTLMPFLQAMYLKAQNAGDKNYDWKTAKSILKGELIENGIIISKWKHEQSLFLLVKKTYSDAIFQYRPEWLSSQSLDIYIPKLNVGIEYQGIQHYTDVDFFGGKKALEHRKVLDEKKRKICQDKGVILVEWKYNFNITNKNLQTLLRDALRSV